MQKLGVARMVGDTIEDHRLEFLSPGWDFTVDQCCCRFSIRTDADVSEADNADTLMLHIFRSLQDTSNVGTCQTQILHRSMSEM